MKIAQKIAYSFKIYLISNLNLLKIISNFNSNLAKDKNCLDIWAFIGFLFGVLAYYSETALSIQNTGNTLYWALPSILVCILGFFWAIALPEDNSIKQITKLLLLTFIGFSLGIVVASIHPTQKKQEVHLKKDIFRVRGTVDIIIPASFGGRKDSKIVNLKNVLTFDDKTEIKKFFKIQIYCSNKDIENIKNGDYVSVLVKKRNDISKLLPGGYDFSLKRRLSNISFSCYSCNQFEILQKQKINSIIKKIYNLRQTIYKTIKENLSEDVSDFAAAFIIGEAQGVSSNTKTNMRNSGLSHILCVSGLHLSLFSIFCFRFLNILFNLFPKFTVKFNTRVLSYIISVAMGAFYWTLSGMNVATTRAFIMSAVATCGSIISRKSHSLRILGLAMAIVLICNPQDCLTPSFQLSFGATFALITSIPVVSPINTTKNIFFNLISKLKHETLNSFYLSNLVSIITAPIVIYHFYSFNTYQALANLFAVPIAGIFIMPCVIFSLIAIMIGYPKILLYLMSLGICCIIKIADFFAHLPYSVFYFGRITKYQAIGCVFGIFIFQIFKQRAFKIIGLTIFLIYIILACRLEKPDIIIDVQRNIVGIKSNDKLIIYANNMSKFLKQYWNSWFGQREVIFDKLEITKVNLKFKSNSGEEILIYNNANEIQDKSRYYDIVINMLNDEKDFSAKQIILKSTILKYQSCAIFIKNNKYYIEGINQSELD